MELSLEWAEDRCCKLIGRFDYCAGAGGGGGGGGDDGGGGGGGRDGDECIDKDRNGYNDCNQ